MPIRQSSAVRCWLLSLLLLLFVGCVPVAITQSPRQRGGGGGGGNDYWWLPNCPCPELFRYQYDGSEWFGMLEIPADIYIQETIRLSVLLSVQARLTTSYVGQLELYGSREAAQREILQRRPVRYEVRFPIQSPLPSLKRVECNGRVLCSGRGVSEPTEYGGYAVTDFWVGYEYPTGLPPSVFSRRQPSNNEDTFIGYEGDGRIDFNFNKFQPPVTERTPAPPVYTQPYRPPVEENDLDYLIDHPVVPTPQRLPTSPRPLEEECGRLSRRFSTTGLIVGGTTIPRGTWPWLAAVYVSKGSILQFYCGGNLVSKRVVVTAAHCFRTPEKEYFASDVYIHLGRYNIMKWLEKGSLETKVEHIHVHPDYMKIDMSYDADLAVVVMAQSVEFSDYIRPICMWDGPDSLGDIVGASGTIVGWGRDNIGNNVTPEPNKISVPIVSDAECLRSSDTFRYITSNRTFCVGRKNGFGPCKGDSGSGMAMYKDNRIVLRGIVSVALSDPVNNTCNLSEYVVLTDAAKFGDWIRSFLSL